jgi:hypothetical protein
MKLKPAFWLGRLSNTLLLGACVLQIPASTLRAAGEVEGPKFGAQPLARLLAATCKITNPEFAATCFLVEPPPSAAWSNGVVIVVTASHAFEETPPTGCQIVLREQLADGSLRRKEVALPIRADGKPIWVKHPDEDVAALKWTLPAGVACQPLRFEQLAKAVDLTGGKMGLGDEAWIFCFPVQLEASAAGLPILRHGCVASWPLPPLSTNRTFFVDFSTFGGDSGAPVMIWNRDGSQLQPLVIGVVLGMERQTDRTSMPFEERIVHHPVGLAIAAHSEIIRETVELLLKE